MTRRKVQTQYLPTLASDTETTGIDLHHGCLPFFLSTCDCEGNLRGWEWDVDPTTRLPLIARKDRREIKAYFAKYPKKVYHNSKFDIRAKSRAKLYVPQWKDVEDTLVASHVLASGESHALKDLALQYLDVSDEDQKDLQDATNEARRYGRKEGWRIANPEDPHFPATKRAPKSSDKKESGWWKLDTWLPRAVAKAEGYKSKHPWWTVLRRYAMLDAERTIGLWLIMREALEEEGLMDHYLTRRKLLRITYRMEEAGMTGNTKRMEEAKLDFGQGAQRSEKICYQLADKKIDNLRSTQQVQSVLFSKHNFGLKPVKETKSSTHTKRRYAVNAEVIKELKEGLSKKTPAYQFLKHLEASRKLAKMVTYIDEYQASKLGAFIPSKVFKELTTYLIGWFTLHPNYNVTGTVTTRFSASNPNAQNISKQELYNLRQIFGPIPGREWYSLDYQNIELRVFAYESGDKRLIKAFEDGFSAHLVIAEQLHPILFKKLGPEKFVKTEQYGWTKNGTFSLIYGATQAKANATYHVPDAYEQIRKQLPLIDKFMWSKSNEARKYGFITTLGGYRLQVDRNKPYVAVNYFVQGSAGWAMIKAMIRVDRYLKEVCKKTGEDYRMIMTIHDELVFDFPKHKRNRGVIKKIKALMEQSGSDIGLPCPVDVELIKTNWSEGIAA